MAQGRPGDAGDHKGPPHAAPPPSPLRSGDGFFVRLMGIQADKSAPTLDCLHLFDALYLL